jgi:Flp pilus assembly protein TadG
MLPPLIQRPPRSAIDRRQERGVTLALVALAIFSIIAMAGLSIDVGTLYQASAEAQRSADAAALAAAQAISVSGITGAGTPATDTASWQQICGGASSIATQTAVTVAQQNTIAGTAPSSETVTYSSSTSAVSSGNADCSTLGAAFGVNPVATVKVTQASLPTYFSRIWGRSGSSVSATASAEAFNPSGSSTYAPGGQVVPVQPRCVKPLMLPNLDPLNPATTAPYCSTAANPTRCNPLVAAATGSITNPGILAGGSGVIGETFWLTPDCRHNGATCTLRPGGTPPQANIPQNGNMRIPLPPNLDYLPGQASYASAAIPSCASGGNNYAQAIAGCDQSTQYQCGVQLANAADLSDNPGRGDTTDGAQCLIHQGTTNNDTLASLGQDMLQPFPAATPNYPFQIQGGTSNPLTAVQGNLVTSSTSIVSLPIYDSTAVTNFPSGGTTPVTVIGFLQVFINYVDGNGNLNVTVMNVAGCGNAASGTALTGTSPVPVRLITPP